MRDGVGPGVSAPALLLTAGKISASHRCRDAYVYVRQSTPTQMVQHTESLARQYELRERAVSLGWPGHQVVVIDADLGRSGAQTDGRLGFKELVADVGLGKVGIVLGIEVSRLARNNADWYQLLDLCAITDTLIADADGVYHPADFNDRLVLGLKGTMSEAELHLIKSRLTAGLKHKAAKGELRQGLPVGLDYDEDDRVMITADEAVREAIATVFRRFDELGSARQVLMRLREDGVLVPRRANGSQRIRWAPATYPAVHDLLTNPAYAGAFVFGRTRTEKRVDPITGAVRSQSSWCRVTNGRCLSLITIPDISVGRSTRPTPRGCAATGAGPENWLAARCAKAARCCRGCCAAGGAGGSCRPATRAPRATARAMCVPAPNSCMRVSTPAKASVASGWRIRSSTRCLRCCSPRR